MKNFLVAPGCVIKVIEGGADSAYSIEGLETSATEHLIIIDSIDPEESDIYALVPTLNDLRVIYNFGKDFGMINISGRAFLGVENNARTLKYLDDWFKKYRISEYKKPISVSIASQGAQKVYIVNKKYGGANSEYQYIPFSITGVIAPLPQ